MKKALVLAAALAMCTAPAAAQESPSTAASVQQSAAASTTPAPSLFVSQDEIRQRVAAGEVEREGAQVGSRSWWYTVAAVAVGVVIALVLIDS